MTKEDYMHLPKERLAEMLAERDKMQAVPAPIITPIIEPYVPWWREVVYYESTTNAGLEKKDLKPLTD